ncbi:FtsQ-type POTRA domain-containing protein [bacterium]|nr:FtsQ-type POTRA domain-containing protein [bacterium]
MQSLGRALPLRRDPAPSRWAYRMQRLWLTPLFRVTMRVGMPAFFVVLAMGIYLSDANRREAFANFAVATKEKVTERPMFMVNLLSIDGASPELADAVRRKLNLQLPQSSLTLDLNAVRAHAEELDAVDSAVVRLGAGNVLQVTISERQPAWVWRTGHGLMLLDATGHRIAGLAARDDRADLPLVAGEGADQAVAEAKTILAAARPWASRIRGLVRISDRRWDLVLDRDQRILLPADDPIGAVEGLIALDKAENILARDLTVVDLRNPLRPVLRLAQPALAALRQAQGLKISPESKS